MSEIEKVFEDSSKFDSQREIVVRLLDDKDLETKTDLDKPLRFSVLNILEEKLKENGLQDSSTILTRFREYSFKYLISKGRQGRKEYIEALQSLNQQNQIQNQQNPLNPIK